ncbi:hypothetical protein G9A89_002199 [Geosiphon pyriformis]|nr:hypothetical protein G9A89_002199 [Geosiphon pyriformis]
MSPPRITKKKRQNNSFLTVDTSKFLKRAANDIPKIDNETEIYNQKDSLSFVDFGNLFRIEKKHLLSSEPWGKEKHPSTPFDPSTYGDLRNEIVVYEEPTSLVLDESQNEDCHKAKRNFSWYSFSERDRTRSNIPVYEPLELKNYIDEDWSEIPLSAVDERNKKKIDKNFWDNDLFYKGNFMIEHFGL